ncbi:hypothetical protein JMJ58_10280 [Haloterrigena salifodinae]|uniref:Uncharacterized protein n=1 Tax=Haloterrigena salifodinae TaxID=2675099 RepID=A0A8T8DVP3_9EURY|nr:hypothetical protein [Haloterrigena salifodinae]QRV13367.1 hypothetical protein JMJ58_10280 [Haloterrigena salifodinae]
MNRTTSIALAAILVVAAVAVPFAAASATSSGGAQSETDADDGTESIEPGAQFAATVGVQNAELEGNVSERAFDVRIANAESNATKAAVIAAQFNETDRRLTELEDRLEELNESREAGDLSEGRYRAEVATTVAEMRSLERRADAAETAAAGVPEPTLADHGVDVESIRRLRDRAGELGGPETAAIARSIVDSDDRSSGGPNERGNEPQGDERGGQP